jgi:long-chain acyl-CoA synthetase
VSTEGWTALAARLGPAVRHDVALGPLTTYRVGGPAALFLTAESIDDQGYFHTGVAGFFDEDGHLKIIDRAKDVGKLSNGSVFAPNYIENKLKFFPHIKEAVCFGHDRDRVCAFLNIDIGAVGNWAERRGMPYAGYTDLAAREEVCDLVQECVEKVNAELARDPVLCHSQVRRFLVLHK